MFTVTWNEHEKKELATVEDVDRLLEALHARYRGDDPQLVTVELDGGDSLAIGVGQDRSVLNYVSGSKDPPYFTSTGELDLDEPIAFMFNGSLSEFPMRNSVPMQAAREAVKEFCTTGALSPSIAWEED